MDLPPQEPENLIIVRSIERPDYISVVLIAKADWSQIVRKMAEPKHYTALYSLARPYIMEGYNIPNAFKLRPLAERAPYIWHDNLETQLRTKWLGRAPETIEQEVNQLVEIIKKIADESSTTFQLRNPQKPGVPD